MARKKSKLKKRAKAWLKKSKETCGDKFDFSEAIYSTSGKPVFVRCNNCGHGFERIAMLFYRGGTGTSCPRCEGVSKRTLESFLYRAGKIHGDKYDYSLVDNVNGKVKINIGCSGCNQNFNQRVDVHLLGHGCPTCEIGGIGFKSEKDFGNILKEYFPSHTFIKTRPKFLLYPKSGRRLELDFYCKELNIAFEVNGTQHYEYVKYFHGDKSGFLYTLEKDKFKKKACLENGITLYSFDLRTLPGKKDLNKKEMEKYIANIKNKVCIKI